MVHVAGSASYLKDEVTSEEEVGNVYLMIKYQQFDIRLMLK